MQDFQDRQGCLSGQTQKLLADLEFGGRIGQLEIWLYLGKMSSHRFEPWITALEHYIEMASAKIKGLE